MMRRLTIVPAIVAALLAWQGGAPLAAGQQAQPQQAGQHEHGQKPGMEKPGMQASCEEMMARHQKMMDEMKAMDARLDGLVQKMNTAQGQAKVDAMAAAVTELVQQRKTMHERMMTMHQGVMGHMMGHMAEGKESMAACPMMKMMKH
jgi:septal ring factor EnvC (AmiA/AmiB activator)